MNLTRSIVRRNIRHFLTGRISLNQLIQQNARDIDELSEQLSASDVATTPEWELASELEGLLSERIYRHISEPDFYRRLGELAAESSGPFRIVTISKSMPSPTAVLSARSALDAEPAISPHGLSQRVLRTTAAAD